MLSFMENVEQKAIGFLEQFRNIAARADRCWRTSGNDMYQKMRDAADISAADIQKKLKEGFYKTSP